MSFIKKKDDKGSSIWDWIILIVLVVGGLGFWWYYKAEKSTTLTGFIRADSLFKAGNYTEALKVYEELKTSDYMEPAHDSILSERLDTLFTIFEEEEERSQRALDSAQTDSALSTADTSNH